MIEKGKCKSCGAAGALEYSETEARCTYCGNVFYYTPWNKLNPFVKKEGAGSKSKAYIAVGIFFLLDCSIFAAYLDRPGWFRSDLAITLWAAIIPFITLLWAANLHPEKRTISLFILAVLANAVPFLTAVLIKHAARISSDDLWGITGMFAACSAVGFIIGAIINNFRKVKKD